MLTEARKAHPLIPVPAQVLAPDVPREIAREFVRGYADVSGNIRVANRYVDGRYRVRLDVLNSPADWSLPVRLCQLLQERLDVPLQLITWGHPNLGREFREHQLNVFATDFLRVGFGIPFKQEVLEHLAKMDQQSGVRCQQDPCPGERRRRGRKPRSGEEQSMQLPPAIRGKHFNAYWQICRRVGCKRRPAQVRLPDLEPPEDESNP